MSAPRRKGPGLAKAVRLGVLENGNGAILSRHLEEALFAHAEILSEGRTYDDPRDGTSYGGSLMITFDLDALALRWRGAFDPGERQRLLDLLEGSVRVRARAMRFACAEAARRVPDGSLGTARLESRFALVGGKIHLDVDVEVPVDVCSHEREA